MHHFSSPPNRRGFFESSSERSGSGDQYGKYPAKIYTIDGVLIYQADNGGDNTGKTPLGGVVTQSVASSMMVTIANPIIHYGINSSVINQDGHSKDLYNYYWTSYSRGTDGKTIPSIKEPFWHNAYLDGYIPLRVKSIYDPCPYLYRIPSNGTYNQFTNAGWTVLSYLGGASWKLDTLGESWFLGLGNRNTNVFFNTSRLGYYNYSTASASNMGYIMVVVYSNEIQKNRNDYFRYVAQSVRCIDFATLYEP